MPRLAILITGDTDADIEAAMNEVLEGLEGGEVCGVAVCENLTYEYRLDYDEE